MKSIVLLWPLNHYYSPSVSILYQAKILKENGYDVNVVYSNLLFSRNNLALPEKAIENPEEALKKIVSQIEKLGPDFVFIGSWREHAPFVNRFAKSFKERNPEVILIHGGHNPTFAPEDVIGLTPQLDYLLRGEAEYSLFNLCECVTKNKNINYVKGVSYKKGAKIYNTKIGTINNLDKLPLIDYEDVMDHAPSRIDLRSSRGCIMECSFCNLHKMWPKPVRYYSNDHVISQIRHLKSLYEFDYIHFIDEMFLCNVSRARRLADDIHKNFPDLRWGGMIRNEFITKKQIDSLSYNGFCNAAVGIESNNQNVLKFLNKTPDTQSYISKIYKSISIMKERLKTLEIGLITATPVEDERNIIDLVDFIKKIKEDKKNLEVLRIALGKLVVYPGTELWKDYEKGKIELIKDKSKYTKYESFFGKNVDNNVWARPWNYTVRNNNFKSIEEYNNILRLAYDEAKKDM